MLSDIEVELIRAFLASFLGVLSGIALAILVGWIKRHWSRRLSCADCGLSYVNRGWIDVTVPDDVWQQITPTGHEGGVLCVSCISRRLVNRGMWHIPAYFGSGPFTPTADQDEFGRLLREAE